jgi:CubicO group peptidase (beta-lactamase class C family)
MVPPAGAIFRRILGVEFMEAVRWSNDPRFLCGIVPAGNIVATANECSRFMQLLLDGGELDGVRIFEPRTITRAVAEQSYLEVDTNLLLPLRYSMGFMLGSKYASFYGLRTPHAFGHLGFTNTLVYADPERDIAVSLMTSGKPIMSWGVLRMLGLLQSIAFRCPRDWGHP